MARLAKPNSSKPWKAEIKHDYRARFLGYFETKEEAEQAERNKRMELTGSPVYVPRFVMRDRDSRRWQRPRDSSGRFTKGDLDVAS